MEQPERMVQEAFLKMLTLGDPPYSSLAAKHWRQLTTQSKLEAGSSEAKREQKRAPREEPTDLEEP